MSKMKELSNVLDEILDAGTQMLETAKTLTAVAEKLITATKAVRDIFSSDEEKAPPAPTSTDDETAPTKEDVRKALASLATAGHKDEAKAIIVRHGAESLTKLDPSKYAAVIAEAEAFSHE